MAEISQAFGSPFGNTCSLKFDIAPMFESCGNSDFVSEYGAGIRTNWIGIVTLYSLVGALKSYKYEVFKANNGVESVQNSFVLGVQPSADNAVIRGSVMDTNNLTFTFPISSPDEDYFVLVTPTYGQSDRNKEMFGQHTRMGHLDKNGKHIESLDLRSVPAIGEAMELVSPNADKKFGIFYTSKVIAKRNSLVKSKRQEEEKKRKPSQFYAEPAGSVDAPPQQFRRSSPIRTASQAGPGGCPGVVASNGPVHQMQSDVADSETQITGLPIRKAVTATASEFFPSNTIFECPPFVKNIEANDSIISEPTQQEKDEFKKLIEEAQKEFEKTRLDDANMLINAVQSSMKDAEDDSLYKFYMFTK